MKIGIAQINPALGDLEKNLALCVAYIGKAKEAGVDLLVFPELALTGYFLKDLVPDVALTKMHAALAPFQEASREMAIVLGGVYTSPEHHFYNAAFYFSQGALQHIHRKVYLPTYGMFDERRYFAGGKAFRPVAFQGEQLGLLICEDAWHLMAPYLLTQQGVGALVILSSSPARGEQAGTFRSVETWRRLNQFYAEFLTTPVIYGNRVGYEDGVGFSGGSQVFAADGRCLFQAPEMEEGFYVVEIDPEVTKQARLTSPLLRDEKIDLVLRELQRVWQAQQ